MKEYFNLNERARKGWNNNGTAVTGLPEVVSKTECQVQGDSVEIPAQLSVAYQVLMYVGTFTGVLLSTAVTHFQSGNADMTFTLGELVVSAVIALVIIPVVYEKLNLNPEAPFIVQFGLFVQNGVFWHVLIDSIGSIL
jgi:hypothetical protein